MSLALKPLRPIVQWLGEPEFAFADGLVHIDPKVGIPATGPWSRDQPNHPTSVTAGFVGTADCIAKARIWLARAAEGVDGDDDLRHGAATTALAAGVDVKVVQHMLRHASETTTGMFYTSVLPEVARAAAEKTALIIPRAQLRRL